MIPMPLSVLAEAARASWLPGSTPDRVATEDRAATGGCPYWEVVISSVSTDTRELKPGALFVAIEGERFDGHSFLNEAAAKGAAAAVVHRRIESAPLPCLVVENTLAALGDLARRVRLESAVAVVAVTGSVGKTTTKEMIALALSGGLETLKSEANQNNEIGVPATLLRLETRHQAAVVEMGMRAAGEIGYLSRIALPDAAVITRIGVSHIGRLGSQEAIAEAKSEILEGLRAGGAAILNKDDPFFEKIAGRAPRVISFGTGPDSDVHPVEIQDQGLLGLRLVCAVHGDIVEISLAAGGPHLVTNAMAAMAAAHFLGVPPGAAAAALSGYAAPSGRGAMFRTGNGAMVIDDAYNASPESIEVALQMITNTPGYPRRIAVLGDMLEMGEFAPEGHRKVGAAAAASGIQRLICVGPQSRAMAEEARRQGMEESRIRWYPDSSAAAAAACDWKDDCDVILVKGSNGTRMNVIVDALRTV